MMESLQAFRRAFHLVQHAVNPVADAKLLGERFQVNVRSPGLEGFHNQRVDQLDDWRIRVNDGLVVRNILGGHPHFHFAFGNVLQHLVNRIVGRAVILVQGGVDVFVRCHAQFHVRVEHALQGVHHVQIGGISQGNGRRYGRVWPREQPGNAWPYAAEPRQ